jgi:hypothetical protein
MAVTTVNAFNDMMEQFLTELNLTFPDNKAVIKFQASFELVRATKPSAILDGFMDTVQPYVKKIMNKDDTFITDDSKNVNSISDIDLDSLWVNCSDQTKGAIWQYMHTLVILGTTIKSFPADTLTMIEQLAEKCAGQMAESPLSLMDLMNTISQQK